MTNVSGYREGRGIDVGWRADGQAVLWAAVGGLVAAFVTGIAMQLMGMLVMGPAALVGSDSVWAGWTVHLIAGVVFGAPFGLWVHTPSMGKGALYGALWGFLVGVVFAWIGLFSILNMPLFSGAGAMDVILHVLWGIIIGLVTAIGLGRRAGRPARRL